MKKSLTEAISETLKNKDKRLIKAIQKDIDLTYVTQKALFQCFEINGKVFGYKVEWNMGFKIIGTLKKCPKYQNIFSILATDLEKIENVLNLKTMLDKKTPITSLDTNFTLCDFAPSFTKNIDNPLITHLLLIITLHNQLKHELFYKNLVTNSIKHNWFNKILNQYLEKGQLFNDKSITIKIIKDIILSCNIIINMYCKKSV